MCASVEYSDYGSDVRAMRVFVDGYIRQHIPYTVSSDKNKNECRSKYCFNLITFEGNKILSL